MDYKRLEELEKALKLVKASLNEVPKKLDSDKLERENQSKMKTLKHMNGKNTEQYNHEGEKKINKQIESINKDESADLNAKIKAKKKQYKDINFPMQDPMKVNTRIAARDLKDNIKKEELDSAPSINEPEGLKNKKKPVTHDECGRPFAKDELDNKIKSKLKDEMARRNFGEADATRHIIDRDRGEKISAPKPKKSTPLLQSELVKFNSNGQWELNKMSNYGPKGAGAYNPIDNIKRKQTRTSEVREDVGQNKAVRQYTTYGSSRSKAHEDAQQKKYDKEAKSSARTMADMTPEEIQAIKDKYK